LRLFHDDSALKALMAHLRNLQDQKRKDKGEDSTGEANAPVKPRP
jgi:hypothetical protein